MAANTGARSTRAALYRFLRGIVEAGYGDGVRLARGVDGKVKP